MNVTLRPRRWIFTATLGVALATGLLVTEAAAGRGDKVSATVNGHRIRLRRKRVCDGYSTAGFSFAGGQKARRLGQTVRSLALACVVDLTTTTFPVSPDICMMSYLQLTVAPGAPAKEFLGSTPDIQVTFESFVGTRLQGTFSGTLQALPAGSGAPATVTNGKFSLVLEGELCT